MHSLRFASFLACLTLCSAVINPLGARAQGMESEVDLELVLLVDVSRSMTPRELEIQRQGYVAALRSDEVFAAIRGGLLQTIALTYIEWAGGQRVAVDWTLIQSRDDLTEFANAIEMTATGSQRRTSISGALATGGWAIENNAYTGLRRVIDISGDGPNNQGRMVTEARDEVVAKRIVINGLPLMTEEGMGDQWHLEDLDVYYQNCVIGGPGAFILPVYGWTDFPEAVRRKLVLEIAGRMPSPQELPAPERLIRTQYAQAEAYDCEIGEKIWAQRRMDWTR
jgi:hypothetical protein